MIEEDRISQPETATDLSEKAMSINATINRLQNLLKRCGPTSASDNFPSKARDQFKTAVYHFRKEVLRYMAAELDIMLTFLNTALCVYACDGFLLMDGEIVDHKWRSYQRKDTIRILNEIQQIVNVSFCFINIY